jgi:hypothetical protein
MIFFLLPCDHNNYLANQRLKPSFVAVIACMRHLGTKALADASHIMITDIQSGGLQPTKPDHLKIRRVSLAKLPEPPRCSFAIRCLLGVSEAALAIPTREKEITLQEMT